MKIFLQQSHLELQCHCLGQFSYDSTRVNHDVGSRLVINSFIPINDPLDVLMLLLMLDS